MPWPARPASSNEPIAAKGTLLLNPAMVERGVWRNEPALLVSAPVMGRGAN